MKRLALIAVLLVLIQSNAYASAGPTGETCYRYLKIEKFGGYNYVCIKAPRSLSNPLGKKLVWSKPQPISKNPSSTKTSNSGYWTTQCVTNEVANPSYDPSKGFSAIVNEPTIRTQQCSQVWVNK